MTIIGKPATSRTSFNSILIRKNKEKLAFSYYLVVENHKKVTMTYVSPGSDKFVGEYEL